MAVGDSRAATRVATIDALRGAAAMLVVLYHLEEAVSRTAEGWLWLPFKSIAQLGFLGVDIFFVISGFVIALSVSRAAPTWSYLGRFILRRSIRLDPPYWTAIVLELVLLAAALRVAPGNPVAWPSGPQLVSHLFYAQELLGYGSVVVIFWTLCYEIQFYVFYVLLTVLRPRLPIALRGSTVAGVGAALIFALSLWTRYWPPEWLPYGVAINRWFQFYLGALTWRAVIDRRQVTALAAAWVAVAVCIVGSSASLTQLLAVVVSMVVLASARLSALARMLEARPLLWLGSISYSLYLYHSSVGWRFVSLMQWVMPGQWLPLRALAVYAAGITLCVLFAAIMSRLVERPFLRLAQRVRLPLREADAGPSASD
jgi:peptidoglycan/LPS O-acetylase OafA/YrhL